MRFLLVLFSLTFLAALAVATALGKIHPWIAPAYFIISLLIIPIYGWDKFSARRSGKRTAETTLHLLELIGGWPGALLAQQLFRHKTQKASYQRLFWLIVALHLLTWIRLLFPR